MILITKKEIERIYDDLYSRADKLFKEYNPCQFNPETGWCIAYNDPNDVICKKRQYILCCVGCHYNKERKHQHSLKSGCRVKSLGCKLFLCYMAREKVQGEFLKERMKLIKEAYKLNYYCTTCRGKVEAIKQIIRYNY